MFTETGKLNDFTDTTDTNIDLFDDLIAVAMGMDSLGEHTSFKEVTVQLDLSESIMTSLSCLFGLSSFDGSTEEFKEFITRVLHKTFLLGIEAWRQKLRKKYGNCSLKVISGISERTSKGLPAMSTILTNMLKYELTRYPPECSICIEQNKDAALCSTSMKWGAC